MCWLCWFLDPGGWSKTAAVGLYFIFPGIYTLSLGEDPIWVPHRLTRILKDASMDDDVPAEPADVLDEPTAGEDGAKMGDTVGVSEADASPA
ncbi:hypothetical protein STEG23_023757 [Scotinomys teguina]